MDNFYERLKIGNEKEKYIVEILNLIGLKFEMNNLQNVTDIDLKMDELKIIMDVKYIHTPFFNSETFTGITPDNCLPLSIKHINTYYQKQQNDNYEAWICFLINLEEFNINEIKFVPVSYLKHLIETGTGSITNGKLNIDRNVCSNTYSFLDYCNKKGLSLNRKKYSFK